MRKRFLPIILAILMLSASGCHGKKAQTTISFSENGVLTVEIPTNKDGSVTLPQPAGTHAAFCIGWQAEKNGEIIFLPIGASFEYNRGDHVSFTPVYLHLITEENTCIDLSVPGGAILYTSTMGAGEWSRLIDIGAKPQAGTLILAQADYAEMPFVTHGALANQEVSPSVQDLTVEISRDATAFCGSLQNISAGKRLTPYTAIGYVKLTYSDGTTTYIYATPQENDFPCASLLGLSKSAAADLSDTQNDIYITPIGDKYSPYTAEEYALLQDYTKIKLSLVINYNMRGNRGLAEDFLDACDQRTIQYGDASCAEEWRILRGLITDINQNGALVITAKDGTPIERDNVSEIIYHNVVEIKNAVFYNGSIYIPYSTYSGNY